MPKLPQVTRDDILAASRRISEEVLRTPLLETRIRGHRVWMKCENLQAGGSFKLRGATNRLAQLTPEERRHGVVAFSSGNHAQGVAMAARKLGVPATIVMPSDAPRLKVDGTISHGAEVIFYERNRENREELATRIAGERGSIVVPSFDDADVVAGQGTVGLEILEQMEEARLGPPSRIVVNCGGGGLSAGIALACPGAEIVPVEPEGWDDMRRSLDAGEILSVGPDAPPTLCDALQTPRVSPITFGILKERGVTGLAVSEAEVVDAVRWAWTEHRLVLEPGGAAAIAALLAGKVEVIPETVAVASGGNVDPQLHARLVA